MAGESGKTVNGSEADSVANWGRGMLAKLRMSTRGAVEPFLAMDVLAEANAAQALGRDILHLEVGQPGGRAPEAALAAAGRALQDGRIGYTDALGMASLRARIARHYGETHDLDLDPARIVVTTGSSAGFILAYLALFDIGARVAVTEPGYPANRNILKALDLRPESLRVGPHNRWQPTAIDLIALNTAVSLDGALVASPSNPTGAMLPEAALAELIAACRDLGIQFISDEIYHGLTYGEPASTALRHDDHAIVVNSFSKYFCMTGWRIGWMVVPEEMLRGIERLAQNLFISPPMLSQVAAEAALDATDELEARRVQYADNRRLLANALTATGKVSIAPPDGAFYLYADVRALTNDSAAFASEILKETGVAVTPGLDFDSRDGGRFLRLSFAEAPALIEDAAARLSNWFSAKS